MQSILNFESLLGHLAGIPRHRVAVACPHDSHTTEAVEAALHEGFADFILFGKADIIKALPLMDKYAGRVDVVAIDDTDEAARAAVMAVRLGRADVLMKGMLNTDNLLRAVLNKEHGILPPGNVLTHITAAEIPGRDRLLFFTDAAVIPSPTLPQRVAMVEDIAGVCRAFGIDCPRIALIHCTEKTSPKFPLTLDYANIKEMAAEGHFGHVIIDGPMDVKVACDPHAGALKGIVSPIEGRADALIMPDIESGNVFYKTLTGFAGALTAGMLVGTSAPVVLPSRGDSTRAKLCSLAMACLTAADR